MISSTKCRLGLFAVVLRPSNVKGSEYVATCDSVHSWRLYRPAPLGNQAASTMTQSHYSDIGPTSPCTIPIMMSTRLGSDKHQFQSHYFNLPGFQFTRLGFLDLITRDNGLITMHMGHFMINQSNK